VRSRLLLAQAALAVTLLAGCTFSVGVDQAPTLETETGVRPDIDCGADPIPAEKNGTATCLLVDPTTGLEFDVTITFTSVDADANNYTFDIKVADAPNNAPTPTAEPGASVPVTDIEQLAVQALTPHLDFVPGVVCDATEVEIVAGNTVDCVYDSPDGAVPITVTITSYDSTTGQYSISVDPA
jgi:hypothetical protein